MVMKIEIALFVAGRGGEEGNEISDIVEQRLQDLQLLSREVQPGHDSTQAIHHSLKERSSTRWNDEKFVNDNADR